MGNVKRAGEIVGIGLGVVEMGFEEDFRAATLHRQSVVAVVGTGRDRRRKI